MRQNTGENPEQSGSQQWRGQPRNPPYQSQPQQAHPPQQGQRGQQQGQSYPPQHGQSYPPQQQGQPPQQTQGPGQSPQGQGLQQSRPQQQQQQTPLQPPMTQQGQPQSMQHFQRQEESAPQQSFSGGTGTQPGATLPQGQPGMEQPSMGQPGMGQQLGMSGQQMQGRSQQLQEPRATGLQPTTVDDIVQTDVITAERDTPLPEVVDLMETEDVGAVVLVEENKPVGIVTDRKIALSLQKVETPAEQTAGDVSSEDVITGNTSMAIADVLGLMNENSIRRLPIVDDDHELEGIVTLDDLLVLLGTEMKNATEIIRSQSSRL